jgi:hypothetical protein
MRFACKGFVRTKRLAKTHEEPRLEATLAGFDIRSPRESPSAGVTPAMCHPNSGLSARSATQGA